MGDFHPILSYLNVSWTQLLCVGSCRYCLPGLYICLFPTARHGLCPPYPLRLGQTSCSRMDTCSVDPLSLRALLYFGWMCNLSVSIGTSQAELRASSQVATCAGFVPPKVRPEWMPGSQEECNDRWCCQKKSVLHVVLKVGAQQTSVANFISLPHPRVGPPPDWELRVGTGLLCLGLCPSGPGMWDQTGWSTSCPWLPWESQRANAENNILGWGPRSWPASMSKPYHKLK